MKKGWNKDDVIVKNVDFMADKLKKVAVDKELLEFKIKLLDKFIIADTIMYQKY